MGLIDDCEEYFGSKNLYDVLSLEKKATSAAIKKAYRKASLLVHPDRAAAGDQAIATRKFQVLAKVHLILSDSEKRAVYDETGLIDEENCISADDSTPEFWEQYWRNLFPRLTTKDINNFFEKYKGSEEEIKDLKDSYLQCEGDMDLISEHFIGYHVEEEDRIREILMELVDSEELPSFPKFNNESDQKKLKRKKRLKKEEKEASKAAEESDGLFNQIMRRKEEREKGFNSMIQNLEMKYGGKGKKKK